MARRDPVPPPQHEAFASRFPELAEAWGMAGAAAARGPLDLRTARLVKLALAIGAGREGAVHADVRKALAAGVTAEEIEQVVALSASTIGFPAAVAVFTWVEDLLRRRRPAPRGGARRTPALGRRPSARVTI